MVLGVVLVVLEVSPGREAPGKKPQVLRTPLGSKNPGPLLVGPLGPGLILKLQNQKTMVRIRSTDLRISPLG